MGGLNSLDGLWVDWIFGGCLADGGRADTLIYKLTHVHVCVCILAKGCPPVRLQNRMLNSPLSFFFEQIVTIQT